MVDKLIISDDRSSLYLILKWPNEEWVHFRVISKPEEGRRFLKCRLSYSREQRRLSESKSTKSFRSKNPDGLLRVKALIEKAIDDGLV